MTTNQQGCLSIKNQETEKIKKDRNPNEISEYTKMLEKYNELANNINDINRDTNVKKKTQDTNQLANI